MKIANLEKTYNEIMSKKHQIELELKDLEAQKAMKEAEAQSAADSGNLDLYRSIKVEMEGIDECIFVKSAQLHKYESTPLEEDTVLKAWDKYAADYDKKFDKMLSDYEKARHDLFLKYMQIVNLQNDALQMRERCGRMMGMKPLPDQFQNGDDHYKKMRMQTISINRIPSNLILKTTIDTEFFSKYGEIDENTARFITGILNTKQSR